MWSVTTGHMGFTHMTDQKAWIRIQIPTLFPTSMLQIIDYLFYSI